MNLKNSDFLDLKYPHTLYQNVILNEALNNRRFKQFHLEGGDSHDKSLFINTLRWLYFITD